MLSRNPEVPDGKTLEQVFKDAGYYKPKNWHKDIWELGRYSVPSLGGIVHQF